MNIRFILSKSKYFANKKGKKLKAMNASEECVQAAQNRRRYSLTQMHPHTGDISRSSAEADSLSNIISFGSIEIIIIVVVLWTSTNRSISPLELTTHWFHMHLDGYVTLSYILIIMVEHNSNNSGKICE